MAKTRVVNTKFWDDKYIRSLDSEGKLLFMYLFTNSLATIAGAYEIELERMEFDTKIPLVKILELLDRFATDNKAFFEDGWVLMINTIEHQATTNPKIRAGIQESVKCCPDWIKHRLSIAYDWLSHLNLNLNLNLNSIGESPAESVTPPLREIFLGTILAGIQKRLDVKSLSSKVDWEQSGIWAHENGFTSDQYLECFDILRQQSWRDGPVKPKHLEENLPNLEKLRRKTGSQNGSSHTPNAPPPDSPNARRLAAVAACGICDEKGYIFTDKGPELCRHSSQKLSQTDSPETE